ncbi:MAG: hypothetical protein LUH07_01270 [Lachnospiraceae bacterium]|nr:hypothetical protein [Lachnospiraceae bacterium]
MQPDKQEQSLQTMMQINNQESENDTENMEESTLLLSEEDEDGLQEDTDDTNLLDDAEILEGVSTEDPVRMYLKEIGSFALLSPDEEIELAKRIADGDNEARELNMSIPHVEQILTTASETLSLDTPVGEDDGTELGDFVEDQRSLSPEESAVYTMLQQELSKVLDTLSECS